MSFYSILNELNDYAGQREVVAEDMGHKVYGELLRYSQDLKAERKHVSAPMQYTHTTHTHKHSHTRAMHIIYTHGAYTTTHRHTHLHDLFIIIFLGGVLF